MFPAELSRSLGLSEESTADDEGAIDEDEVYKLLGNERRRACLEQLSEVDGAQSVTELSEEVADTIADDETDPDEVYDSVYISLCQTHLPKLDEKDLVDYDSETQSLTTDSRFEPFQRRWLSNGQAASRTVHLGPELVGTSAVTLLYLALAPLGAQQLSSLLHPVLFAVHLAVIGISIGSRLT